MRWLVCVVALIIYMASFSAYVLALNMNAYPIRYLILWYNYTTFGLIAFTILDDIIGIEDDTHKAVSLICKFSICINYIIIILYHQNVLTNPVFQALLFNGMILAVAFLIFISAAQHGYFKQHNENVES